MKEKKTIKYFASVAGSLLIICGIIVMFVGSLSTYVGYGLISIVLGVIIIFLPYLLDSYFQYMKLKKMEDQFPRFLRDFAEAKKSGMTLPQAFSYLKKTDYGALNPEIKKSSHQLSWGMSFSKVLNMFTRRIKGSKLMKRTFTIINESFRSGGDIAEVMDTLSVDIKTIKEIEKEKKSMLSQQGIVVYIIFFLFLGILVMLNRILMPMLEIGSSGGGLFGVGQAANYCEIVPTLCTLCPIFNFGVGQLCYFRSMFFIMVIIQAISSGIIVGEIVEESATAGIKHILLMLIPALIVFMIFV